MVPYIASQLFLAAFKGEQPLEGEQLEPEILPPNVAGCSDSTPPPQEAKTFLEALDTYYARRGLEEKVRRMDLIALGLRDDDIIDDTFLCGSS
jgi:hypothetical protein